MFFFTFSILDMVAGAYLTIVITSIETFKYFGFYDNKITKNPKRVPEAMQPRDILAKTYNGGNTMGTVGFGKIKTKTVWWTFGRLP